MVLNPSVSVEAAGKIEEYGTGVIEVLPDSMASKVWWSWGARRCLSREEREDRAFASRIYSSLTFKLLFLAINLVDLPMLRLTLLPIRRGLKFIPCYNTLRSDTCHTFYDAAELACRNSRSFEPVRYQERSRMVNDE